VTVMALSFNLDPPIGEHRCTYFMKTVEIRSSWFHDCDLVMVPVNMRFSV